jgi:hypothetical protein
MKSVLSLLCIGALALSVHADATNVIASADTTISEGGEANAAWNADTMIVGRLTGNGAEAVSRGLIRFDLSSLPSNIVVTSVTLTLSISRAHSFNPDNHAIHRLNSGWSESNATWETSGTSAWLGGNFAELPDSTTLFGGDQSGVAVAATFPSTPAMVSAVQTWLTNASQNFGWLLRNEDEETLGNSRRISSHEAGAGVRPVLTIGYTVGDPPPAPDFTVTSPGFYYNINAQEPNPELTLTRGSNYIFEISTDASHPFQIASGPNFGDPAYSNGVSNNNISSGRISFTVPMDAPDSLYYVCSFHFFGNVIHIINPVTPPPPNQFNVTSPGFFYKINGQEPNPELTLVRGSNYFFNISTDFSHPFQISASPNFGAPAYNGGVSNNTISSGTMTFTVPLNAPDTLYYVCAFHFFGNAIHIIDSPPAAGPLVQIVSMNLSASNVVLRSIATNGWPAIPEYSSNLVSSNWAVVPSYSNALVNGTNVTTFNRLDTICGPNVYLRIKSTPDL